MHKKYIKFFNRMRKYPRDYGPRVLFIPTEGEDNYREMPILPTEEERQYLGIGKWAREDFVEKIRQHLNFFLAEKEYTCGELASLLNKNGVKTARGGIWSARLVKLFTKQFTNLKPYF